MIKATLPTLTQASSRNTVSEMLAVRSAQRASTAASAQAARISAAPGSRELSAPRAPYSVRLAAVAPALSIHAAADSAPNP